MLRRPFYLFAHTHTLFAFLAPTAGASRPSLFARMFREQALRSLDEEGIPSAAARSIVDDGPDVFCKASDRRVIGTMLDHAHMSRAVIEQEGSTDLEVLRMVRDFINSSPTSILGMESPRGSLGLLLGGKGAG
jgi:hypothetical protein